MDNKLHFLYIIIFAFILNLFWEIFHYQLFIDLSGIPKFPHIILASITDAFLITIILFLVTLKNKDFSWLKNPKKRDYILIMILGIFISFLIERRSLIIGRWQYKELMPTIIGIGISPLIQIFLTAILSIIILNYYLIRNKKSSYRGPDYSIYYG